MSETAKHCKRDMSALNQVIQSRALDPELMEEVLDDATVLDKIGNLLTWWGPARGKDGAAYKAIQAKSVPVADKSTPLKLGTTERAQFILDLAVLCDLDELKAVDVVRRSDFWVLDRGHTLDMLLECREQYFEERRWLLEVVATLLRTARMEVHEYKAIAFDLVQRMRSAGLVDNLLEELESLHKATPPDASGIALLQQVAVAKSAISTDAGGAGSADASSAPMRARVASFNQQHQHLWAMQKLEEERLLLQVLLLALFTEDSSEPSPPEDGKAPPTEEERREELQCRFERLSRHFLTTRFAPADSHVALLPTVPATAESCRKIQHLGVLVLLSALELNALWRRTEDIDPDTALLKPEQHPVFEDDSPDEGPQSEALMRIAEVLGGAEGCYIDTCDEWWRVHGTPAPHSVVVMGYTLASNDRMLRTRLFHEGDPAGTLGEEWALLYLTSMLRDLQPAGEGPAAGDVGDAAARQGDLDDDDASRDAHSRGDMLKDARDGDSMDSSARGDEEDAHESWFVSNVLASVSSAGGAIGKASAAEVAVDCGYADGSRDGVSQVEPDAVESVWDPDLDVCRGIVFETLCALVARRIELGVSVTSEHWLRRVSDLFCEVYANDADLTAAFWDHRSKTEMHAALFPLLKSAGERYPYDSRRLLQMVSSLIGSPESAMEVFNFLGGRYDVAKEAAAQAAELWAGEGDEEALAAAGPIYERGEDIGFRFTFTHEDPGSNVPVHEDGGRVTLRAPQLTYQDEQVSLPINTTGRYVDVSEDLRLVVWDYVHSAWPVLLSRVAAIATHAAVNGASSVGIVAAEEVLGVSTLIVRSLAHQPALLPALLSHLEVEWRHRWLAAEGFDPRWETWLDEHGVTLQSLVELDAPSLARKLECHPSDESLARLIKAARDYRRRVSSEASGSVVMRDEFIPPLRFLCRLLLSLIDSFAPACSPLRDGRSDAPRRHQSDRRRGSGGQTKFARMAHAIVVSALQGLVCIARVELDKVVDYIDMSASEWGTWRDSKAADAAAFGIDSSGGGTSGVAALVEVLDHVRRTTECVVHVYPATMTGLVLVRMLVRNVIHRRVAVDLHEPFALFDEDGDEEIDAEEFTAALKMLGFSLSAAATQKLLSELDENGDHRIQYHEFVQFVLSKSRPGHSEAARQSGGAGGAGETDSRVARELQQFLNHLVRQTPQRLAQSRRLVSLCVDFANMCFVGHSTWTYAYRGSRWQIATASLRVLRDILQDFSEVPPPTTAPTTPGASMAPAPGLPGVPGSMRGRTGASRRLGSLASIDASQTIRDGVLNALLTDRGLQTALTTSATILATSAFRPGGAHVVELKRRSKKATDTKKGVDTASSDVLDYEQASRILPLRFIDGLMGPMLHSYERFLVEDLAEEALGVLQLVLSGSDSQCPPSVPAVSWRAAAKVRLLTRQFRIAHDRASKERVGYVADGEEATTSSSPNCNLVVALAGLTSYEQLGEAKIPVRSTRLLTLLCRCMAAAKSHAPPAQPWDTRQNRGGTQYSITAYLNVDGPAFREKLFARRDLEDVPPLTRVANARMKIAALEFARAVLESQPGFAGNVLNISAAASEGEEERKASDAGNSKSDDLVLGSLVVHSPSALLDALQLIEKTDMLLEEEPQLLTSALHFLLTLWRCGTESRRHSDVVRALRNHKPFWTGVARTLDIPMPAAPFIATRPDARDAFAQVVDAGVVHDADADFSERVTGEPSTTKVAADVALSSQRVATHCYGLSARSYAFHLLALELFKFFRQERPAALKEILNGWTKGAGDEPSALLRWADEFVGFGSPDAAVRTLDMTRKECGVDVRCFRVRGDDLALDRPSRRYGGNFVYDTDLIARRLDVVDPWLVNVGAVRDIAEGAFAGAAAVDDVDEVDTLQLDALKVLWATTAANCAWSLADAQVEAIQGWRTFMEVACWRQPARERGPEDTPITAAADVARWLMTDGVQPAGPTARKAGLASPSVHRDVDVPTAIEVAKVLAGALADPSRDGSIVYEAMLELAQLLSSVLHMILHEDPSATESPPDGVRRKGAVDGVKRTFPLAPAKAIIDDLQSACSRLFDSLSAQLIPSRAEVSRGRASHPRGLAHVLGLSPRELTLALELRVSLSSSLLLLFRSVDVGTAPTRRHRQSSIGSLASASVGSPVVGSAGHAPDAAAVAAHELAVREVSRRAQEALPLVIECLQLADITQPDASAVKVRHDDVVSEPRRSATRSGSYSSFRRNQRARARRQSILQWTAAELGMSRLGVFADGAPRAGDAAMGPAAAAASNGDGTSADTARAARARAQVAWEGNEGDSELTWGPMGGALFRVCVALLDVLVQRLGPAEAYLPMLRTNAVLPTLMRALSSATGAAAATFSSFAEAWRAAAHSGALSARTSRLARGGGGQSNGRRMSWRERCGERAATGERPEEETVVPVGGDFGARLPERARQAVEDSMARAEVVLYFMLLLSREPLGCAELHACGLSRLLASDPLLRRMEATLRQREVEGGWAAMGSRDPYPGFRYGTEPEAPGTRSGGGGAGGRGGAGGVEADTEAEGAPPASYNFDVRAWEGDAFGLGPTRFRGYADGQRARAHRVWCLYVQLVTAQARTLQQCFRAGVSSGTRAQDMQEALFRFVDAYSCTLRTSLTNRALSLATIEEATVVLRLMVTLLIGHLPAWRLRTSRIRSIAARRAASAGEVDASERRTVPLRAIVQRDPFGALLAHDGGGEATLRGRNFSSSLAHDAAASLEELEAEREHRLPGIIGIFVRASSIAAADFAELLGDGDGHVGRMDADLSWRLHQMREKFGFTFNRVAQWEIDAYERPATKKKFSKLVSMALMASGGSAVERTEDNAKAGYTTWNQLIEAYLAPAVEAALELVREVIEAPEPDAGASSHAPVDEDVEFTAIVQAAVDAAALRRQKPKRARLDGAEGGDGGARDGGMALSRLGPHSGFLTTSVAEHGGDYDVAQRLLRIARYGMKRWIRFFGAGASTGTGQVPNAAKADGDARAQILTGLMRSVTLLLVFTIDRLSRAGLRRSPRHRLAKSIRRILGTGRDPLGGDDLESSTDGGASDSGTEVTTSTTVLPGAETSATLAGMLSDRVYAYGCIRFMLSALRAGGDERGGTRTRCVRCASFHACVCPTFAHSCLTHVARCCAQFRSGSSRHRSSSFYSQSFMSNASVGSPMTP